MVHRIILPPRIVVTRIKCIALLTIIALTLISEGCGERDRRETGKDAGEAGVLVSAEFIKLGTDGWEAGIIDEIRKTQEGKMYIDRITIDGKRVTGNPYYGNRGSYVELSPGKHTYRIEIKTNQSGRFFVGLIEQGREASWSRWGEIEVERSRMYVVIAYLKYKGAKEISMLEDRLGILSLSEQVSMYEVEMVHKITCAPHRYDQTTGFATHPADSNLSFKLK